MLRSVVLGEWLDRPLDDDLISADRADEYGYHRLWIGEMAKCDSIALTATVLARTTRVRPVVGPLAVSVRSPVQVALAASTLSTLARGVDIAIGTSSPAVVDWHERSREGSADTLSASLGALRELLDGGRHRGFRLREPVPSTRISVAAFGSRALAVARRADDLVLNMVTPLTASRLTAGISRAAVWLVAAVDPDRETLDWLRRGFVPYLAAPGYGEMFIEAGFADLVAAAREGASPRELVTEVPDSLLATVALIGSRAEVESRMETYRLAGITEMCLVPVANDLAGAQTTLEVLAPADSEQPPT